MGLKDSKPIPEFTATETSNFWAKVDKRGEDECWPWTGARDPRGYGRFCIWRLRRTLLASRISYVLSTGEDPGLLNVLHRCDNPPCVNPFHLFPGTDRDNAMDASAKGRMKWKPDHATRKCPEITPHGENHYRAKLTSEDVTAIRALHAAGTFNQKELGGMFGVNGSNINMIVHRKKWRHLP